MTDIKRKLYRRGSSFETTIPMPLLFALDLSKKQAVIFTYDKHANRWYLGFEEAKETKSDEKSGERPGERNEHHDSGRDRGRRR